MLETNTSRAVTWRSVLLGLFGVVLICGVTPYNDYALNNTFLVGNNLPLGVLMIMFVFVLLINGPLNVWRPRWALSAGELAVAMSMMLVSCALPSSGLMRFWPGTVVLPFWHARSDARFLALLETLDLPKWLFPTFTGSRPSDWMIDPVVTGFAQRWTENAPIPLAAWIRPGLTWGIFFAGLFGFLICMTAIVRRQWFENERLPFPLAQIELALLEQPQQGRMLNSILRQRTFWIAFALVFSLHLLNGLHEYFNKYVPQIPLDYDLRNIMANDPWRYTEEFFRRNRLFLSAVGVAYFLSAPVGLSLWAFFVGDQVLRMYNGMTTSDPDMPRRIGHHIGGIFAFAIAILWVGRAHWMLVIRQAWRGERGNEPRGRYLSYPVAFWGMCVSLVVMLGWLWLAGGSLLGAIFIVICLLLPFFVLARIVAETGWIHGQLGLPLQRPVQVLAYYGVAQPVPMSNYYVSSMLQGTFYDYRETLPVYASHGMKLTDQTRFEETMANDSSADRRTGRKIIASICLALVVGYVVSLTSSLWVEYTYHSAEDSKKTTPINAVGFENPRWQLMYPTLDYQDQKVNIRTDPVTDMGTGFGITALLSYLRLRYTWWPLHPIGFLILGRWPTGRLWFSFFVGWILKTMILRFGGAKAYSAGRVFFIGLILGDCIAAGFWLVIGILLSFFQLDYHPIMIMPE